MESMDIERGRDQSGDPEEIDMDARLSEFFDKGLPLVDLFLVLPFVSKMLYHHRVPIGLCWSITYLACLVLCFAIHLNMKNRRSSDGHVKCPCMMAYLSTVLRMLSAAALVLFLDTANMAVVSPALLLVLALVAYWFWQTLCMGQPRKPGMNWEDYKDELDFLFKMSVKFVPLAFGGLSGKVMFYTKGSPNQLTNNGYNMAVAVAPECLLFYGAVLGLVVVLLCTVPPRVIILRDRDRMAREGIRYMAYVALLFVVLASVVASVDVLGRSVLSVCFCIAIVGMVFYYYYGLTDSTSAQSVQDTAVDGRLMTTLFTALMVSHSKYGVETSSSLAPLSFWFKGFLLMAFCCILCYAIHITLLLVAEARGAQLRPQFTKVSDSATIATMVAAAGCFFLVCLRGDEIKNIVS